MGFFTDLVARVTAWSAVLPSTRTARHSHTGKVSFFKKMRSYFHCGFTKPRLPEQPLRMKTKTYFEGNMYFIRVYPRARLCGISAIRKNCPIKFTLARQIGRTKLCPGISTNFLK